MFRSGFIGVVGRPNVGKSTLLNRLVGQKVAITSNVAQTTRHRIRGVVTVPKTGQVVLLDTPGFSKPLDTLGNYLTAEGQAALNESDGFMVVVNIAESPGKGDMWVLEQVKETGKFILLVMNKADTVKNKRQLLERNKAQYLQLMDGYSQFQHVVVSARTGKHCDNVVKSLIRHLPEGPAYYDEDALTDQRMREMTAELIREQIMRQMADELPHSVAVVIDKFDESNPEKLVVTATLYVNQTSQKGMVIGKGGHQIKAIGQAARKSVEDLVGTSVFLDLNVAVKQNWRKDEGFIQSLGLATDKT